METCPILLKDTQQKHTEIPNRFPETQGILAFSDFEVLLIVIAIRIRTDVLKQRKGRP